MKTITLADLQRWKRNSLELAKQLKFDKSILDLIDAQAKMVLSSEMPPEGSWYGWCHLEEKEILVYYRNLSTEDITIILNALRSKGLPEVIIEKFAEIYDEIGPEALFEVYNQSGMDHEIIGHLYNDLAGRDSGEEAAVNIQIWFAKKRGGDAWRKILEIMPIILGYHKGIDVLKR